jgi:protein-arginine kinase activator protein McsA
MFNDIGLLSEEAAGEAEATKKNESDKNIARLRLELDEAIAREDYERAAQLRDMLGPLVNGKGRLYD